MFPPSFLLIAFFSPPNINVVFFLFCVNCEKFLFVWNRKTKKTKESGMGEKEREREEKKEGKNRKKKKKKKLCCFVKKKGNF